MKMKVILCLVALTLLTHRSFSSQNGKVGCKKWNLNGGNVCCDECHAGNRLIKKCGPNPRDLCKPCESGTFVVRSNSYECSRCTQCVGVQIQTQSCTATSDTKCGCREGYLCGDDLCSFCTKKCDKGFEPEDNRSCRKCPDGTYNDKSHQKCKPWNTKCPNPEHRIVTQGNSTSDIQCAPVRIDTSTKSEIPAVDQEQEGPFFLTLVIVMVLLLAFGIIIITVAFKLNKKESKPENPDLKNPIIRPPTDEPRTLVAIESSFNEAQQEQGSSSSTESLISKEPAGQLIV